MAIQNEVHVNCGPSSDDWESVLITKRGKPVAQLSPAPVSPEDVLGYMAGKVKIIGDIVSPVTPLCDWETK
jgi:hypothetical protein